MRYFVTIQHPGHVHFFRHAIRELQSAGHEVHLFARAGDVATELMEAYELPFTVLATGSESGVVQTLRAQLVYEYRLLERARTLDPDILTAIGGTAAAHVSSVMGAHSVIFSDTEHAPGNRITFPFADEVWTPDCFRADLGPSQVTYPGLHELAYLHPNRFDPDPSILDGHGIDSDEPLVLLRTVSWAATHDVGESGFTDIHDVVNRLEEAGARVVITAESTLPESVSDRRMAVPPHRLHHLLAQADLVVGEGATTAVEAAVLGTPAVYVNSLRMGYIDEVADYGLLFTSNGDDRHESALDLAVELLGRDVDWSGRQAALLGAKVDTTDVVLEALTP